MGLVLAWTSGYPAAVDDQVTNFPTLTNSVHDVLASHQNVVAGAVVYLERENKGFKDNSVITGVGATVEDQLDVERVVGSVLFDGADLSHLIPHLRMLAAFNPATAAGTMEMRLYDMGPPGAPLLPPELRSTAVIGFADAGSIIQAQTVLTTSASPGVDLDQIYNSLRLYELRVILNGATNGSQGTLHWAGLALGVTQ